MGIGHSFFALVFVIGAITFGGCDLQPHIASIPDSIGDFISERYPALLADPETEPEIYNSAVTDYGVYASPELYGSDKDYLVYANVDDYVFTPTDDKDPVAEKLEPMLEKPESETDSKKQSETTNLEGTFDDYLLVPDYVAPKEVAVETNDTDFVVVMRGDTLYSIAKKNNTSVGELAKINSLNDPYTLSIGQKIKLHPDVHKQLIEDKVSSEKKEQIAVETKKIESVKSEPAKPIIEKSEKVKTEAKKIETKKKESKKTEAIKPAQVKRVAIQEITIAPGDTLYSLSRKYQIPVNDLAVMNKISSPFALSVGQKLKVPKIDDKVINPIEKTKKIEPMRNQPVKKEKTESVKAKKIKENKVVTKNKEPEKTKISSDPKKQLPKISARSAAKFSWPIRGKILSQYGAKEGGLFNDGINISAGMGALVKAAENGVVAYAGNEVKGMGNLIIIQHSDGWMTVYAHLESMVVRRGTKVDVGQQIGKIGKTGKVDKPQLHFEIRKGTKAYNPVMYLKK